MGEVVMILGPLALLAALGSGVHYYLKYRNSPEPKRRRSLAVYILGLVALAVLAYPIGVAIGIAVACASADAGNLCGLIGVFGLGPLFSGVAILGFAHSWYKHARLAP